MADREVTATDREVTAADRVAGCYGLVLKI